MLLFVAGARPEIGLGSHEMLATLLVIPGHLSLVVREEYLGGGRGFERLFAFFRAALDCHGSLQHLTVDLLSISLIWVVLIRLIDHCGRIKVHYLFAAILIFHEQSLLTRLPSIAINLLEVRVVVCLRDRLRHFRPNLLLNAIILLRAPAGDVVGQELLLTGELLRLEL